MDIDELKGLRTALYGELNQVLEELQPLKDEENHIRSQILEVQERLFIMEMPKGIERRQKLADSSDNSAYKYFMENEIKIYGDQVEHLKAKYAVA